MTPEQKLEAFFAESTAPARDPLFEAEAAQRVARHRAMFSVVAMAPWAVVATIFLWGVRPLIPVLVESLGPLHGLLPGMVGGAVLAAGVLMLTRRLGGRA